MFRTLFFILQVICFQSLLGIGVHEKKMVIVVCSYNNAHYYIWNLDSLLNQNYSNYSIIYIDDCSTDGTADLVANYLALHDKDNKVKLIKNSKRQMALANLHTVINTYCLPNEIVVIVDGDDRLYHNNVLSYLNAVYQDSNIWLTYGQFIEYPSKEQGFCKAYPEEIIQKKRYRYYSSSPSHLRTFYAGLFHKINEDDLKFQGNFFPICYDLAIMFPMLEMADGRHKFISEILLEYNAGNPINDHKVAKKLQRKFDLIIRARTVYRSVDTLF